jgi:hypothetical protein
MATFEEFAQKCAAQNVVINPLLGQRGDDHKFFRGEFAKGPPHPLLQGIVRAGILLRKDPGLRLTPTTDRLLDLEAFGSDVPMLTLATMCNDSLQPAVSENTPLLPGPMLAVKGVCEHAEECWIDVLEERRLKASKYPMAELYTANGQLDGRPILARKAQHEQTSLTFTEVTIGGIRYPEGGIFNMAAVRDGPDTQEWSMVAMPKGYSVRAVGDVACATFLRLSAYALPPDQRAEYGLEQLGEGRTIKELQGEATAGVVLSYLAELEAA